MDAWAELVPVIARLRAEQPGALQGFPDPSSDHHQPPFILVLAPWAVETARDLHGQFGDRVVLTVGALPYPPGRAPAGPADPSLRRPDRSRSSLLLDPAEVEVELDGPAVVRSGHMLRHGLLLRNRSGPQIAIATNGHVTAVVIDPADGEVAGGLPGPQTLALRMFRVAPAQTERIPLLIGTASLRPELGYAVPAGEWGLQADLTFGAPSPGSSPGSSPGGGQVQRRTPVLPLTVTP
jgi:hypothetical protein